MTTRVFFVDDEHAVVDALRRQLRPMRDEWDMEFFTEATAVLAELDKNPAEALVTDIRMPGMDGVELLQEIKKAHPSMVRFVLSGHANHASSLKLTGLAHQFLAKPCDPNELRTTLNRALKLRHRLTNPGLIRLVSEMGSLPTAPGLFSEVVQLVNDPDSSLADLGNVMSQDTAMSAKVLQLVNSSFFGLRNQVADPALAVTLLGLNTIMALVLGVHVFSTPHDPSVAAKVEEIQRTSMAAAIAARQIAITEGLSRDVVSEFYLAGMMHDVGRLMLAASFPDRYLDVADEGQMLEAEDGEFGATHQHIGAYLLGLWGLPDAIVEATAFHHTPSDAPVHEFGPLAVTHVVAAVAEASRDGEPDIDMTYLEAAGAIARLDQWIIASEEALRHA